MASPALLAELEQVAERIRVLVSKAPDIAIFEIMQMDPANYVVAHHLQAAALSALIAQALGWPEQGVHAACRCQPGAGHVREVLCRSALRSTRRYLSLVYRVLDESARRRAP